MEVWKTIPGFERYQASSLGRVRNGETYHILKQKNLKDGYLGLCLRPMPGMKVSKKVHQLVALAFFGKAPFLGAIVAHKDGSRTLNVPDNLYWTTQKQNHADREFHGRTARGSKNGATELTETHVAAIKRMLRRGATQKDIARVFSVCPATISNINTGKYWRHVNG
ncbi:MULTISPECIES: NUMOD4 domain-containing protein [unclassified Shinella]|uniref:NUMOD4 domain-containing protein n=1 Tax=unclassified Shinella TaxID=2643062 RepID=UPI0030C87242